MERARRSAGEKLQPPLSGSCRAQPSHRSRGLVMMQFCDSKRDADETRSDWARPFTPTAPPPAALANQRPGAAASVRLMPALPAAGVGEGRPSPGHCRRRWGASGAR